MNIDVNIMYFMLYICPYSYFVYYIAYTCIFMTDNIGLNMCSTILAFAYHFKHKQLYIRKYVKFSSLLSLESTQYQIMVSANTCQRKMLILYSFKKVNPKLSLCLICIITFYK